MKDDKKNHWENIYTTKAVNEVSWYQAYPTTVVKYLETIQLPLDANIIDIGGGESNLVDILLDKGYLNIWVLDISATALEKTKARLGSKAQKVNWVVKDITEFKPLVKFDFWYDRAVFHFLIDNDQKLLYKKVASAALNENGHFFIGTFSENGPLKCSGLEIQQYAEADLIAAFQDDFKVLKSFTENHSTPFNTLQNFQFCGFQKS